MSPVAEKVLNRLDGVRQQWWIFSLFCTGTWAVSLAASSLLALMVFDALIRFSQIPLILMAFGWVALVVFLGVIVIRRVFRDQRTLEATARCIEHEYPELGSHLINVVQFAEDKVNQNREFVEAALSVSAKEADQYDFEDAAKFESRWRRFHFRMQTFRDFVESLGVLGLVIGLGFLCHLLLPNLGSARDRLLTPWEFVPSVGEVEIEVSPGDVEILLGDTIVVTAEINDIATDEPYRATLFLKKSGESSEEVVAMSPGEQFYVAVDGSTIDAPSETSEASLEADGTTGSVVHEIPRRAYSVTLPAVIADSEYRVEIGDSQTPYYTISVVQRPTVEEVQVTYEYPAYLGRESETSVQRTADLSAPQYTNAKLRITPSVPITQGWIEWSDGTRTGRVEEEGRVVTASVPMTQNTVFTIHLKKGELEDPEPRVNQIRVVEDEAPSVEMLKPSRKMTAAPGDEVPIMIRASDDHGLGRVLLEVKVKPTTNSIPGADEDLSVAEEDEFGEEFLPEDDPRTSPLMETSVDASVEDTAVEDVPGEEVEEWTQFETRTATVLTTRLILTQEPPEEGSTAVMALPGETVFVRAVAWDRRTVPGLEVGSDLGPQQATSAWKAIEVVDPSVEAAEEYEELDNVRGAVFRILEKQIRAQAINTLISRRETFEEASILADDIRTLQVDIQTSAINIVRSIGEADSRERLVIKTGLNQLAFGGMLEAIEQCDALQSADALDASIAASEELYPTQSDIIEALRIMLNIARRAQSEQLEEMPARSENDLPDDAREAMENLDEALEEALEAQRRVIEASENLAKAPVEDFAEAEEELANALEAAEDAWEKFQTELNTDLSKLPEQDFANPSLLEELVEIQTEMKMAEGSELAKTKDIAVPLEQLGAEMSEELDSNMEKWLPETPDRERWSQEESLTDEGKEAPMAELPGELEDLIGELLEEEENLFDEMEDVSSSAADSIDEGAGWDAADGPISNMSAKGVTGNRLPNTSEIGGRAGEGRQGRSSGEFVGDEAVGKGGRDTPTRLTDDAYVAGQIQDHSTDPVGGATGGGKESGQTGEGLEGPQGNPRGERDNGRLAGRQADLRSRAEGIDLEHFNVMGYHHTDLQEMIEVMAQVELDIQAGRYQNALRQRQVLAEGLGQVRQNLGGDYELQEDRTANLPSDIQQDILGSMQDPSPAGWETLNRDYFERLGNGGETLGQ